MGNTMAYFFSTRRRRKLKKRIYGIKSYKSFVYTLQLMFLKFVMQQEMTMNEMVINKLKNKVPRKNISLATESNSWKTNRRRKYHRNIYFKGSDHER